MDRHREGCLQLFLCIYSQWACNMNHFQQQWNVWWLQGWQEQWRRGRVTQTWVGTSIELYQSTQCFRNCYTILLYTPLTSSINRIFLHWNLCCFIWNHKVSTNWLSIMDCFEGSNLHKYIKITYLCLSFCMPRKKFIILILCCFLVFATFNTCNCHFPKLISYISCVSEVTGICFTVLSFGHTISHMEQKRKAYMVG